KANTLKEFIALLRASPGKLNYGSSGVGGMPHLAVELFKKSAKVEIAHVPYKDGATAALTAVLGGEVAMLITSVPTVAAQVKTGRLRALAITSDGKRVSSLPDVPSFGEAGVSGMNIDNWTGLTGPAGMPKELVAKLHAEVVKAANVPSVKELLFAQGADIVTSSPEEF